MDNETLTSNLDYDPDTGVFRWKTRPARKIQIGDVAGNIHETAGIIIFLKGKRYRAHHLAWMYVYGALPEDEVDHINHDRYDNRIDNLRAVGRVENAKNLPLRTDSSGIFGVRWVKYSYMTYIDVDGGRKYLGKTKDFFEACCRRKAAELKYRFHENHGR